MITSVEFNTLEKANKCKMLLGNRFLSIWTIYYKGAQIGGYKVAYITIK